MISLDTAKSFFDEYSRKKGDSSEFLKNPAEFLQQEPMLVSLLSLFASEKMFENNLTFAIFALAIYERLRKRQLESDNLKNLVDENNNQKERKEGS